MDAQYTTTKSTSTPLVINPRTFSFRSTPSAVKPDKIKYVIIHHAMAKVCSAEDVHRWHLQNHTGDRQWLGAAYNFFIRKDGSIWEMRGYNYVGAHTPEANSVSMGICLEGDFRFEKTVPKAQWTSLLRMIVHLMDRFPSIGRNIGQLKRHNHFTNTECPGKFFPWDALVSATKTQLGLLGETSVMFSNNTYGSSDGLVATMTVTAGTTWAQLATRLSTTVQTLKNMNPSIAGRELKAGDRINYVNANFTMIGLDTHTSDYLAGASLTAILDINSQAIYDEAVFGGSGYAYGDPSEVFNNNREYIRYNTVTSKPSAASLKNLTEKRVGNNKESRGDIEQIKAMTPYDKFKLRVETADHLATFMFKVDPSGSSESRTRNVSEIKTKGGSIIVDNGRNFTTKTLSGVMLDYNGGSEKIEFIDFYEKYIANGNYRNIYLEFLGVFSSVEITAVSINESATANIIKSYTISMIVIAENTGSSDLELELPTTSGTGTGAGGTSSGGASTGTATNTSTVATGAWSAEVIESKEALLDPVVSNVTTAPKTLAERIESKESLLEPVGVVSKSTQILNNRITSKEALLDPSR